MHDLSRLPPRLVYLEPYIHNRLGPDIQDLSIMLGESSETQQPNRSISGVILAGGRASRMGGKDKGLISFNSRPLIEYVIAAIAPQVETIFINANRNLAQYQSYGYAVIRDRIPDYAGPLAGILAALEKTESELLLCVPCDGPWLPDDLIERLYTALQEQEAEVSCAHDGARLYPVIALLKQTLRQPLAAYLAQGGHTVHRWIKSHRLAQVDFSDCPELFVNINTSEELRQVEGKISGPLHQ